MKVLFDHQIFERQAVGGISRYFTEIISHFPDKVEPFVSIRYSDNEYIRKVFPQADTANLYDPRFEFLKGFEFRGKGRLYQILRKIKPDSFRGPFENNRRCSIDALKAQEFDVFHPTYYDDYFLAFLGEKPFILTIHDMIPELFPEFYSTHAFLRISHNKEKLADLADHIITVSENTKRDIVEIFGIREKKISVIYHAAEMPGKNAPAETPGKYFLYMGDRVAGYKNFLFLLRALALPLREDPNLFLVCSGATFSGTEVEYMENLNIAPKVLHRFIPDSELNAYYQNAVCLIIPSLSEGFGIPILEAFSCSCPVLLADTEIFREIAAGAGLYFAPKDMKDIRRKVRLIQEDLILKQTLIDRGLEQVRHFSWNESAHKTLRVYQGAQTNKAGIA